MNCRFPKEPILPHEPDDTKLYHWAASVGSDNENTLYKDDIERCANIFPCPFSLIEMALGYYSEIEAPPNVIHDASKMLI